MESFEYRGYWWLPDDTQSKLTGVLVFDNKGPARLDVVGAFAGREAKGPLAEYPLILGQTVDGKDVTLTHCYERRYRTSAPGAVTKTVEADQAFIGHHFEASEDIRLHKIGVRFSRLDAWAGVHPFHVDHTFSNDNTISGSQVTYTRPESWKAEIGEDKITLNYDFSTQHKLYSISMAQTVRLTVEAGNSRDLNTWLDECILPLQDFLTFVTGVPNSILQFTGYLGSEADKRDGGRPARRVGIYFGQSYTDPRAGEPLPLGSSLLSFAEVAARFTDVIASWFKLTKELDTVRSVYFGEQYRSMLYPNVRFISVVQALEIYHRARKGKKQDVLLKRILDLLEAARDALSPLKIKNKTFAERVRDTRNYLTHYSLKKEKAAEGIELLWLTQTVFNI